MSIRMRHTRAHTKNRRSHHAIKGVRLATCTKCGEKHMKHRLCENCGTYREKKYIDVLAKLSKKDRKEKEKELQDAEGNKPLDAAELSNK